MMKTLRVAAVLFFLLLLSVPSNVVSSDRQEFRPPNNPIISDGPLLADPHVIEHNGTLYLYPTSNERDFIVYTYDLTSPSDDNHAGFVKHDTPVFTPTALGGMLSTYCPLSVTSFGKNNCAWAPGVYEEDGTFYLYYTACLSIGVAVSDSPLGPFRHENTLCRLCIDAFVERFEDELYFYHNRIFDKHRSKLQSWMKQISIFFSSLFFWSSDNSNAGVSPEESSRGGVLAIYGQRMVSPTELSTDPAVRLIQPSEGWEFQVPEGNDAIAQFFEYTLQLQGVNEGVWVFHHPDANMYVLMYSGAGANSRYYRLGYATSKSPLGPFTKSPTNPIINFDYATSEIHGPGHHAIWKDESTSKVWCFYHAKHAPDVGWERYISVDELTFVAAEQEFDIELQVTIGDRDEAAVQQHQQQCGETSSDEQCKKQG